MTDSEWSKKRILGVGVAIGGLVLLAVALIMGLNIPKFVTTNNVHTVCILESDHKQFNNFVS